MTVDGGDKWEGSDGTSSGDATARETKVTGPAKQGKGKLKSLNAGTNQMTIEDVTSVWVANDNGGSGTGTPETFKVRDPLIEGQPRCLLIPNHQTQRTTLSMSSRWAIRST